MKNVTIRTREKFHTPIKVVSVILSQDLDTTKYKVNFKQPVYSIDVSYDIAYHDERVPPYVNNQGMMVLIVSGKKR